MQAWARFEAGTGRSSVYYDSWRQHPPFPAGSVYDGWKASHHAELWYAFDHRSQAPWRWSIGASPIRKVAEEISNS
jgi:para-nitrobenzyl esterase